MTIQFDFSSKGGNVNEILDEIRNASKNEKKAITPEAIAMRLNKKGGNTDRKEVRRKLQSFRMKGATIQSNGLYRRPISENEYLIFATGQNVQYAIETTVTKDKKTTVTKDKK